MDDDMLLAGVTTSGELHDGGCPFGEIPERNSRPAGPEDLRQGQFGVPGGAQRGVVARDRIYGGLPLTKGVFIGDLWACGVLRQ